jgi:RNA polymerase sigma-70 factor (ECF subfamily)
MGYGMNEMTDEAIIKATLAGDDDAFALLVARYKRRVFSLSARFARDGDELEDICQEVFIKAYENLKGFRNDAPFENWLTRITVHTCYDTLRKNRRTKNHTPLQDLTYEVKDATLEARQAAREAHELLSWAMAKLSPDERVVVTLLELEEKTVREVSELTSWSEGNVRVRAHRARKALKRILEESHER